MLLELHFNSDNMLTMSLLEVMYFPKFLVLLNKVLYNHEIIPDQALS